MTYGCNVLRSRSLRRSAFLIAALMVPVLTISAGEIRGSRSVNLEGKVESNGSGLAGYKVSLYASFADGPRWELLGHDKSDRAGRFQIAYSRPKGSDDQEPVLFVEAEDGPTMLASAIGVGSSVPDYLVVNERTTVATGNAFAQFVKGSEIEGNTYGMKNAVSMAANLADPQTGKVGIVLASSPNGPETTTLDTFNSLTNVVASCVAHPLDYCDQLFKAATPPGGPAPANVLQAVANIVKYPSYPGYPSNSEDPVFLLSQADPIYQPALTDRPTSWLLFLKITGGVYSAQDSNNLMNGPGNIAFDNAGFAWVNDNYVPQPQGHFACAGLRLMKFYPSGATFPGSPYFGGGLSGAGYGIGIDPKGDIWVGNFGFEDPICALLPQASPQNSVSQFKPNGKPVSGASGYTEGGISWPQGTVSDRQGNIWVANCGNDSVTDIPRGNPRRAFNIPLGPAPTPGNSQIKPFSIAIDLQGNVWFTDNRGDTMSVVSPDGKLIATLPGTYQGTTVLTHPVGDAADSKGNIWVANSDWLDVPCPLRSARPGNATNPSITMFDANTRKPYSVNGVNSSPFTGGGLTVPWGITVDGDDTVWVFNFGSIPVPQTPTIPTGISRFCGINTRRCPPGMHVGEAISPVTGYRSNSLSRNTGGQIDPSGNIWVANNWRLQANPLINPGWNSLVIVIGAAGPIKTPLIGPPVPF